MNRLPWVDRKFTFDIPPGWIYDIIERLRGTEHRLRAITREVPEQILVLKPEGGWSIKEHIGHLIDLEPLHTGRVDDFREGKSILRAADMSNQATEAADHNARKVDFLIDSFFILRNAFLEGLLSLDDKTQQSQALHPRLQVYMRPIDLAFFTAEHDDHHLASIRAALHGKRF